MELKIVKKELNTTITEVTIVEHEGKDYVVTDYVNSENGKIIDTEIEDELGYLVNMDIAEEIIDFLKSNEK